MTQPCNNIGPRVPRPPQGSVRRSAARRPLSPRQAARRRQPVDRALDPALFKSLCDPTRLTLLCCLLKCARPASVGEIAACCAVDLSVVSRHLHALRAAGMLRVQRDGRTVRYEAPAAALAERFRDIAAAIDACCGPADAACNPSDAGCGPSKNCCSPGDTHA